jgi:DNA-binding NarL/FixJ family response regulator
MMSNRVKEEMLAKLSRRDRELLQALAEGLSDKEIANRLSLSPKTVRNQMVELLDKLAVESRLQALVLAARLGVVQL